MSLTGKQQGNLVIGKVKRVDKKKYSYNVYYYQCKCLTCGKSVILPSTNIRKYTDCGKHRVDKINKRIPYNNKKGYLTMSELSKKSGFQVPYVSYLVNKKGFTAEQIINKTYPRKYTRRDEETELAMRYLGISRQLMSWRLNHGWVLEKVSVNKWKMFNPKKL